MKRLIHWYGMILPVVIAAGCGSGGNTAAPKEIPAVAVNTYKVAEGPAVYFENYPATIQALNQVDIHAQVSGYITGIYFEDGSHVNKGQKLYSIDPQQYAGTYQQAVANLSVAKANLDKAQKNADRYQQLDKNDAIAKQTLDNALADLEAAKMQVKAAEANVNSVQTNLRYATIYAPFSGVIGISQVKMGAAVSPGTTLLNTISSEDPIAADFAVNEKDITRFVKMMNNHQAKDSVFQLILPDGTVYPYTGTLKLVDRAVDPQTGTLRARLSFRNPNGILKPGLTCNVQVKSSETATALLVPYKGVTEQMGEYFVFVVTDSNTVEERKVTTGQRIADKVIIKDGLQSGEVVVVDGVQKLRAGSAVKPAASDTTATPAP